MSRRLKPSRLKQSFSGSSRLREKRSKSARKRESPSGNDRRPEEFLLDDTDDEASSKKLVNDFIDLTTTPDSDPFLPDLSSSSQIDSVKRLKGTLRTESYKPILERSPDKLLDPLNPDEEQIYQILTVKTPPNARLTSFRKLRSRVYVNYLYGNHCRLLQPKKWVNDEIINAYGMLLNKRTDDLVEAVPNMENKGLPRAHAFSTFFFSKLSEPNTFDYDVVRRWTRRPDIDVLAYDILLFPININKTHWVLVVINMRERCFFYTDSYHSEDAIGATFRICSWLYAEVLSKHGSAKAEGLRISKWRSLANKYIFARRTTFPMALVPPNTKVGDQIRIPHQEDMNSCGVFVMKNMECLAGGTPLFYSQRHAELIRKRMVRDLYSGFVRL